MNSAEICKTKGFKVGDVLEGDEGIGPERIRITAIGEQGILARYRFKDGKESHESSWTLEWRDWKKVST